MTSPTSRPAALDLQRPAAAVREARPAMATSTQRLATPDQVDWARVNWLYALPLATIHLGALAALWPALFSWTGLVVCLLGVHFYGQAINIGYHRLLSHHSFRVPRWFEHLIVFIALGCMQDTPGRWVATHRYHHQYSDEVEDPHTPLVSFLWAHFGWLLVHNGATHQVATYQRYASDVLGDGWYMKLEKHKALPLLIYLVHAVAITLLGAAVGWFSSGGDWGQTLSGAGSLLVWGVLVRTVLVWHITWSVNSLTHLFGYRNHDTTDNSRNNWLVSLLSVGEGWHNNHHEDPASASVQHRWWEIDISYYQIRVLEWIGLASKVVRPKVERRARRGQ
jgi:stearoyl-CoA desaturase (delta-9 desaturase)